MIQINEYTQVDLCLLSFSPHVSDWIQITVCGQNLRQYATSSTECGFHKKGPCLGRSQLYFQGLVKMNGRIWMQA
jgi:hypothetical protein